MQTVDATIQTIQEKPTDSKITVQQKSITCSQNNQSTPKDSASSPRNIRKSNVTPVQAKGPSSLSQRRHKSPSKVLSDRLPKGSDDKIKQFNRFSTSIFCGIYLILTLAMSNNILQWNCHSITANFKELTLLVNKHKPVAVCLEETFLKDSGKFQLKYHSCYLKNFTDNVKVSGGVAVIVNNSVPHHFVKLGTTLQAVAVNISLNKTITV